MAPRVFISHASEDKERFVIPFSTELRKNGVDAWVDQWEMLPGDSLVDKIFEEGLKEAAAVIVVVSAASVAKPWVREELNAAVVARIEKGTRLLPIVLDGCEVPQALRSTVWEPVPDTKDYRVCLNRVLDAVLARPTKPPLGEPPTHRLAHTVHGITAADNAVLATLYAEFLVQGRQLVDPYLLVEALQEHGINESMVAESLEILDYEGYVEQFKHMGAGPYSSRITHYGVTAILADGEGDLLRKVGLAVINDGLSHTNHIAESIGQPLVLVEHAIVQLQESGHLTASDFISGPNRVLSVSPTLRRQLGAI